MKYFLIFLLISLCGCGVSRITIDNCELSCQKNDGLLFINTFTGTCMCTNGANFHK